MTKEGNTGADYDFAKRASKYFENNTNIMVYTHRVIHCYFLQMCLKAAKINTQKFMNKLFFIRTQIGMAGVSKENKS